MRQLQSTNCLPKLVDVYQDRNRIFLVLQKLDCNLRTYMQYIHTNYDRMLDQQQALNIISQIVKCYHALYNKNIIHRDLKPQNILFKGIILKICDFGFSKLLSYKKQLNQTIVGTPYYQSWQILNNQPYTCKTDVWSLGIIFYQLLYFGKPFFLQLSKEQFEQMTLLKLKSLIKQEIQFPIQRHGFQINVTQNTKNIIRKCLKKQEKDRYSWEQLFEIFMN